MVTAVAPRLGLVMTGEFLGTEQQKDRTSGDKTYPGRFLVKLLIGDRVNQVEYRSEDDAQGALIDAGLDGAAISRGDVLSIPVGVRSAKGYTFFYGLRS